MANNGTLKNNGFWNETALCALEDFNQAINALYALDVGEFSGMLMPIEADKYMDENDIDFNGWAEKLDKLRTIVFCDGIDWNGVLRKKRNEGADEA